MDMNRIRYFLTLSETGHLGRAAELHRISAPAFSKAMKIFSQEMGVDLFIPQGRGIILTDKARELVPGLQEIVKKLDSLVRPETSSQEKLRIATFEVFSTYFMEELLPNLFPGKDVLLLEKIPGKIEAAVADGLVDFAFTYNPVPRPELDFLKIQKIEMGIFGRKNLLPKKFEELPFVIPVSQVEGSPSKVRGLDGWPDDRFPRNILYEVELMESAMGLCRRGVAAAYLPRFIVSLHNKRVRPEYRLEEIPSPPKLKTVGNFVYLVKRKSRIEDAVVKKLAAGIRRICSEV